MAGEQEQVEMSNSQAESKKRMKDLYRRQVPGTETLYQGIGYFMRMLFWDTINKPETIFKIRSASEEEDCEEVYKYMIDLMSACIHDRQSGTDTVNNLIFNRREVRDKFEGSPELFVNVLKDCLEREEALFQEYYGRSHLAPIGGVASPMIPTPTSVQQADSDEDIKDDWLTEANVSSFTANAGQMEDQAFVTDSLGFSSYYDTSFLDRIEEEYRTFESFASEAEQQQDIRKREQLQAYTDSTKRLLDLLEESLHKLSDIKSKFLSCQAQMEVRLMSIQGDFTNQISLVFQRYAKILKKLHDRQLSTMSGRLDQIIAKYMDSNLALIVQSQPDGITFVENVKKVDSEEGSHAGKGRPSKGEGSKSKTTKVYTTKKNSGIKSTLMILGFGRESSFLPYFEYKSSSAHLVTEEGHSAGELSGLPHAPNSNALEIFFDDLKVHKHQRESSKNTRSQFVRLVYRVKGICFGRESELMTKSLPFNLVTGSLQALEFTAARLWFVFCNREDMYSNPRMLDEMEKKDFLDMLDLVTQSISQGHGPPRKLSSHDREFLWRQIPPNKGRSSGRATVTEQSFSKTLIGETADMVDRATGNKIKRDFSFFTWFYALVNTFETCLPHLWADGMIYGMLTKEDAEQVLLSEDVPEYTALLRPARSHVLNPNCKNALINIAVEMKVPYDGDFKVKVIEVKAEDFKKHGLYGKLKTIKVQHGPDSTKCVPIKRILTSQNRLISRKALQRRYPERAAAVHHGYHGCPVQEFKELVLNDLDGDDKESPSAAKSARQEEEEDCSPLDHHMVRRRRKACRQDSADTSLSYPSPSSYGHPEWSSNGRNTDAFSPGVASTSTLGANSPQLLDRRDSHDEVSILQDSPRPSNIPLTPSPSQSPVWTAFGPTEVNVRNIPLANGAPTSNCGHASNGIPTVGNAVPMSNNVPRMNSVPVRSNGVPMGGNGVPMGGSGVPMDGSGVPMGGSGRGVPMSNGCSPRTPENQNQFVFQSHTNGNPTITTTTTFNNITSTATTTNNNNISNNNAPAFFPTSPLSAGIPPLPPTCVYNNNSNNNTILLVASESNSSVPSPNVAMRTNGHSMDGASAAFVPASATPSLGYIPQEAMDDFGAFVELDVLPENGSMLPNMNTEDWEALSIDMNSILCNFPHR